MPTIGSVTKTVRISPGDLEVIEGLMSDGTSWSGAIHKLCQGVSKKEENPVIKDIEGMVGLCGCTLENFFEDIDKKLTEGILSVNEDGIKLSRIKTDDFEDVCHDKCLNPQDVLDKATQAVKRGML